MPPVGLTLRDVDVPLQIGVVPVTVPVGFGYKVTAILFVAQQPKLSEIVTE